MSEEERAADWEAYAKRLRRDSRMEISGLEEEDDPGPDCDSPNPHETMERAEHEQRQEYDEDDGAPLDPVQVAEGVSRELDFMEELGVGEVVDRPPRGTKVWSCRWCHRQKPDKVRSRYVVRQFRDGGVDHRLHAGTPSPEAVRVLLILSIVWNYFAATADFSVAFMHTPLEEEVFV